MDVKLNDKWYLCSDTLNVWIEERGISKKTGKPTSKCVSGYHGTIENCLKSFGERRVRELDSNTLPKLIKAINNLTKELKSVETALKASQGGIK